MAGQRLLKQRGARPGKSEQEYMPDGRAGGFRIHSGRYAPCCLRHSGKIFGKTTRLIRSAFGQRAPHPWRGSALDKRVPRLEVGERIRGTIQHVTRLAAQVESTDPLVI